MIAGYVSPKSEFAIITIIKRQIKKGYFYT